jgi:hypothetical protein
MLQNRSIYLPFIVGLALILTACSSALETNSSPSNSVVSTTTTEVLQASPEKAETEVAEASTGESVSKAGQDQSLPLEADTEPFGPEPGQDLLAGAAEAVHVERDPDVPPLPFPDNADPSQCGIPTQWQSDEAAYLSGIYEGELIQPVVFLYESHLRRRIVAEAPHGAEVRILLSQSNPQLDYFLVKVVGTETPTEGWIPAPFVSFEPPPEASSLGAVDFSIEELIASIPLAINE